jgi:hypothetical protein
MMIVAVSLILLVREIGTELDPSRLFRRAGAMAILAFMILIYWNHQAWIADRNIDLYASTGKLDVVYLTRDLSPDAIPEIVERLPALPEPAKSQLAAALKARHHMNHVDRWFEWNARRVSARQALASL